MESKKKRNFRIIAVAVLIVIIIAVALFYFLFFEKLEGTPVDFTYEDYIFVCPDFKSGEIVDNNASEQFLNLISKIENDTENWCYIGTLSGYGAFTESTVINNTGLEIVKKEGEKYYQMVRTHSNGKILAPISINSAQRTYFDGENISVATIDEESRFSSDGNIDWEGIKYSPITQNAEIKKESLENSVQFIAEVNLISENSDENIYSFNGKNYIELTLDLSSLNTEDVLQILTGKISNKAMDLGMELFSPEKMKIDMSKVECKYILEFTGEGDDGIISGRSFTMRGQAEMKGFLTYNMNIDISMNAVILYMSQAYLITDNDLLV